MKSNRAHDAHITARASKKLPLAQMSSKLCDFKTFTVTMHYVFRLRLCRLSFKTKNVMPTQPQDDV